MVQEIDSTPVLSIASYGQILDLVREQFLPILPINEKTPGSSSSRSVSKAVLLPTAAIVAFSRPRNSVKYLWSTGESTLKVCHGDAALRNAANFSMSLNSGCTYLTQEFHSTPCPGFRLGSGIKTGNRSRKPSYLGPQYS